MIRTKRVNLSSLNAWLVNQGVSSSHPRYGLRVWRGVRESFSTIRDELISYIGEAHDDTRKRLRRGFEDNLSPYNDTTIDPASNYPALLHHVTLQGYLGETLAILAVEHWGAHNLTDWIVPVFLFRLHDVELQHLEAINERLRAGEMFNPDNISERRPGRTGDDGIAFRISADNKITDVLTIEAKCLTQNNNTKINEAYKKLSAGLKIPSSVRELIAILEEYDTPETQAWQEALTGC